MTATEVYQLTAQGGASDFQQLIEICASLGSYCLIGGLAVNCYVEPVYTLDADLVFIASALPDLAARLSEEGFKLEHHRQSVYATSQGSQVRIRFTTDNRYQSFIPRSVEAELLGVRVRVACLEDVAEGKLWAYSDPNRRFSRRKKDELDLIRLAEEYPELKSRYPRELVDMMERG